MQKKSKIHRKQIVTLYGLSAMFRRRTTEEERSACPALDDFFKAALAVANKVRKREINPLDDNKNKELLAFIQTWTEFQEEPEYLIHKFGYFQGASHINRSSGNTERQFKALETLVNMLDEYRNTLKVPMYQEARLRAAHCYITAMREGKLSAKPIRMRDAAASFRRLGGHGYRINNRSLALSLFFESQAAKYEAFANMNHKPAPNLSLCIEKMKEAVSLAKKAADYTDAYPVLQKHLSYCKYWANIFQMREGMLRRDWVIVREHYAAAIEAATFFGPSIFPNHFRSMDDLVAYQYIVTSYEQFCSRDFDASLKSLQNWEAASLTLHGESWTFVSVRLRRLMMEVIILHRTKGSEIMLLDEMVYLVRHEFVGKTSRCIVAVCHQLVKGCYNDFEEAYNQLIRYFPLDIYIEQEDETLSLEEFQLDARDLIERVPLPFCQYFNDASLIREPKTLDIMLVKYFCVLREYASRETQPMNAQWESLHELIEDFKKDEIIWTSALLSSLLEYTSIIDEDSEAITSKLRIIKQDILPETFSHFPHVVRINRIDNDSVELKRLWKDYRCDTLRVNLHGIQHNLGIGKYYYMHSEWNRKKLHVLDLHSGEPVPLSAANYYEHNISRIAMRYNVYQAFLDLLEDESTPESAFRDIVGENPWMIEPSAKFFGREVRTRPSGGSHSRRADLLLKLESGLYMIVEFKKPSFARTDIGAVAGQCASYITEFRQNQPDKDMNPQKVLVAGRSEYLDAKCHLDLAHESIELITYDELLKRIEDTLGLSVEDVNYGCAQK